MNAQIAAADAIILDSQWADLVDDSEVVEAGVAYTLVDGRTVLVGVDGSIALVADEAEAEAMAISDDWSADADDTCPGCGWAPGDGVNPNCSDELGCGFWKRLADEELAREEAAAELG